MPQRGPPSAVTCSVHQQQQHHHHLGQYRTVDAAAGAPFAPPLITPITTTFQRAAAFETDPNGRQHFVDVDPTAISLATRSRVASSSQPSPPRPPSLPSLHGRLDDRALAFPTASHATSAAPATNPSSPLDPLAPEPRTKNVFQLHALRRTAETLPAAASNRPNRDTPAAPGQGLSSTTGAPHAPAPAIVASSYRPQRPSAGRLWNPSNFTPRIKTPRPSTQRQPRTRRPSSPPLPSVPLQHPTLGDSDFPDTDTTADSDYPLLTLPQQRQTRHGPSTRLSLQAERRDSGDNRISLPRSVRASYDEKRSHTPSPSAYEPTAGPSHQLPSPIDRGPTSFDKGKSRAVMATNPEDNARGFSADLERGPDGANHRLSNLSIGDGIGSAISSSNSSIMGEDVQPDAADEWGPLHACFPHLNPHVPVDSPEYATTRIIRVRRDWLLRGDLAPTFSDLYPEILDEAGFPEQEFRAVIEKINSDLVPLFNPYSFRNVMDGLLGLVTGWLWDDFGFTGIKSRLNQLERWIEKWNQDKEKSMPAEDGLTAPKLISLRQTGYMTLDIQITNPDPEPETAPNSRGGDGSAAAPA